MKILKVICYPALAVSLLAVIGSCTSTKNTASEALDDVDSGVSTGVHKVRQELDLEKPQPPAYKPVQPRYCYTAMQDIICYGKPLVGQEDRLVAYQNNKSAGYVIDPPPAVKKKTVTTTTTTTTTITPPNATPVPDAASDHDKNLKEITFDPSELEPKKLVPEKAQ